MLLFCAIGDAYGAGFEFVDPATLAATHTLRGYRQHPRHAIRPGAYTDDTQMSLAVAEALLAHLRDGAPWSPLALADTFVAAYHRDPRLGYAGRFQAFLDATPTGAAFLRDIRPASDRNGAAMRATPLGVLRDPMQVVEYATLQARLTHDTEGGRTSAAAAALMAHYCYHAVGPRRELPAFLAAHVPGPWTLAWDDPVPALGIPTVRAALTALIEGTTLRDVLWRAVAVGGDVDTVAAIALACAGHAPDLDRRLPAALLLGLEDGPFGRAYLHALDGALRAATVP